MMRCWPLLSLSCLILCSSCGDHTTPPSHRNSSDDHPTIAEKIAHYQQENEQAQRNHDAKTFAENSLEINYLSELQKLPAEGDAPAREMLESKYTILRQVLADQLAARQDSGAVAAGRPSSYGLNGTMKIEVKDQVFSGPDFTSVYHPLVLDEVNKVYRDFGDLYVSANIDAKGDPVAKELRVRKPWSGYWYPFGNNWLYTGDSSPLAKLDRVLHKKGINSQITEAEKQRYAGFQPDSWEGLCDAWSLAAIMMPEPIAGRTIEGEFFSIADLKAIYTFSHLRYSKKQYGMSYRGDAETDGTFQDIKPEAFHKLALHFLGDENRAFVIDDMPGVQVWNKPLYRYRWLIWQDPTYDYAFLVRGYAWLVKERQQETEELTKNSDVVAPIYEYRLYVDKNYKKDGAYRVVAGQWLGESFDNHPDSVTVPQLNGTVGSHNAEFNKYIDEVESLFIKPGRALAPEEPKETAKEHKHRHRSDKNKTEA